MYFVNFFRYIVCSVLLMLQVNVAHSFEFKSYEIGMKLSDFKSKGVHEDVFLVKTYDRFLRWEPALTCSDNVKSQFIFELRSYPEDSVIVCAVKELAISSTAGSAQALYSEGYMWLKLPSGTYPISPRFTFVSLNPSEEPVLSAIDFKISSGNFQALIDAVIEKYKKPISKNSENVQNSFGAKFRDEKYIWKDASSVIEIQKYGTGSLEKSSVKFYLISGEKILSNLAKRKSSDTSKGF